MEKEMEAETEERLQRLDELERLLASVRRILSKYPKYMTPFNRAPSPFERVEILLSDVQELHALMEAYSRKA
jgi:Mg2+ and Co2+ transporter CorA